MKKLSFLLLILGATIAPLTAQPASPVNPNHWTVDDVVKFETASNFTFSNNGRMVAWTKSRTSSEKDRRVNDIWITYLDKKEDGTFVSVQLTRGEESDTNPFFSKDDKTLYFTSSRDGGNKLWALNLLGGEAEEVHEFKEGFASIQWLNDHTITFVAGEGDLYLEQQRKEKKDQTMVIEDTLTFKPTRVFSFDLKTKTVRRLTDYDFPVFGYGVSKDGNWLVTGHIMSPHYGADAQPKPNYFLWNLRDGSRRPILESYQTPGNFSFTEDHSGFYFTAVTSSDPQWSGSGISELYFYQLADQSETKVPLQHDWGLASGYDVIGNDVLVSLANGPTRTLAYYTKNRLNWSKREVSAGDFTEYASIAAVADNKRSLVMVHAKANVMPQYRFAELVSERRATRISPGDELFRLNSGMRSKTIANSEIFRWTGALDEEVNGILYYPENYQPGRRYPLIVAIHGGPSAVDLDWWRASWAYYPQLMSQMGAFVLMPNYHGSSNHGLKFVESIKNGLYNELPRIDVVTGVQALNERGLIDMDSLGVMGWSNGAIIGIDLSVWHPDMFKVLGAGAGDVNWTSDYGTCAFGVRFDQSYIGGAPWDSTGGYHFNMNYIEMSPLFRMEVVKTPTIIFFGSEDRSVPRDQGWEHYRALQQLDQAPVRFLWFPGMGHGLTRMSYQKRKMQEEIDWFKRHLFGTYKEPNISFKEDSPLATLIKQQEWKRHNGVLGEAVNGVLVPETVPVKNDSIAVGRFEVTNAQFAAFRAGHTYEVSRANHPVTGISLDDATAYTAWLSEKTGRTYRLPNVKEAESFHKSAYKAGKGENTLNYLAGYALTNQDVPRLQQKLAGMDAAGLMQSAGTFKAVKLGQAEVFDLGGNAAEIYEKDGKPAVYGYSAVDFVDPASDRAPAYNPGVTGFRVVREP